MFNKRITVKLITAMVYLLGLYITISVAIDGYQLFSIVLSIIIFTIFIQAYPDII